MSTSDRGFPLASHSRRLATSTQQVASPPQTKRFPLFPGAGGTAFHRFPSPIPFSSAPKKCRGTVGERGSDEMQNILDRRRPVSETFPSGGGVELRRPTSGRRDAAAGFIIAVVPSVRVSPPESLLVAAEGDTRRFQVVQVRSIVGNVVQPPPPPLCMSHTWFRIVGKNKRGSKTVS